MRYVFRGSGQDEHSFYCYTSSKRSINSSLSGVTRVRDWSEQRAAPSPWAELEFDNIILTVPSNVVRDLEQADELAKLWNSIMKSVAELATIPLKFPRKERIVIDVQISNGKYSRGCDRIYFSNILHNRQHTKIKIFIKVLFVKQVGCILGILSWDTLPQQVIWSA